MASFHLSVKIGKAGSGAKHACYIVRAGKYADLLDSPKAEVVEHIEHGNMPVWAQADPIVFWEEADARERKNGSIYREFELALPNELSPEQSRDLVRDFVSAELSDKFVYSFAIHNGKAAIAGEQQNRNAHIMFSERMLDGNERGPDLFFKRANKKNPDQGGCVKANFSATTTERKTALVELRERFANTTNAHLEKYGYSDRVTHLSLKEQGIDRPPERHFGPKVIRNFKEDDFNNLLARRAAEGALDRAQAAVTSTIDISGSLTAALNEKEAHGRAFGRIAENLGTADRTLAAASRNERDLERISWRIAAAANNEHARRTEGIAIAAGREFGRLGPQIALATNRLAQIVRDREAAAPKDALKT